MSIDESLADQIKITVVATGFDEARQRLQQIASTKEPMRPQVARKMAEDKVKEEDMDKKSGEAKPASGQKKGNGELPQEGTEFDIPAFLRQGR
jgi:cell division GTPase FtsZ